MHGFPPIHLLRLDTVFPQQMQKALAGATGPGANDRAAFLAGPVGRLLLQLLERRPGDARACLGENSAGAAAGIDSRSAVGLAVWAEDNGLATFQQLIPLAAIEIEPFCRKRTIGHLAIPRRAGARFCMVGDHLEPRIEHFARLIIEAGR